MKKQKPPPMKLHRVNGYDATTAMLGAMFAVRNGAWVNGAPTHVLAEFLTALADRGFYLGVEDREK